MSLGSRARLVRGGARRLLVMPWMMRRRMRLLRLRLPVWGGWGREPVVRRQRRPSRRSHWMLVVGQLALLLLLSQRRAAVVLSRWCDSRKPAAAAYAPPWRSPATSVDCSALLLGSAIRVSDYHSSSRCQSSYAALPSSRPTA